MRRPSAATLIACLALFVALGGPAEARHLLTGRDIKDHSLTTRDLSKAAVRSLTATGDGTITEAKIADGAVTSAKLGGGAVTAGKVGAGAVGPIALADGAVTGAKVADGSLTAADVARFAGRFRVDVPPVAPATCWSGEPAGLPPEQAGADISQDLVMVTPGTSFDERHLQLTVRSSADQGRFVLALCNATATPVPAQSVAFRYLVLDVP